MHARAGRSEDGDVAPWMAVVEHPKPAPKTPQFTPASQELNIDPRSQTTGNDFRVNIPFFLTHLPKEPPCATAVH